MQLFLLQRNKVKTFILYANNLCRKSLGVDEHFTTELHILKINTIYYYERYYVIILFFSFIFPSLCLGCFKDSFSDNTFLVFKMNIEIFRKEISQ